MLSLSRGANGLQNAQCSFLHDREGTKARLGREKILPNNAQKSLKFRVLKRRGPQHHSQENSTVLENDHG